MTKQLPRTLDRGERTRYGNGARSYKSCDAATVIHRDAHRTAAAFVVVQPETGNGGVAVDGHWIGARCPDRHVGAAGHGTDARLCVHRQ